MRETIRNAERGGESSAFHCDQVWGIHPAKMPT